MNEFKKTFDCSCGRVHDAILDECIAEHGAVNKIPSYILKYNSKKPFVVADRNTYTAAGKRVCDILDEAGIEYSKHIFKEDWIEPDEKSVGSLIMHYDPTCDMVIGIGSGVINDLCKILANVSDTPYMIVATAPSMDGYASATSSMARDGLKISLPSKCANVVIGDIDILKNAPERMLISGLGDMLAKYISICEWRISNIITGEYYCETIAELVRSALKKCIDNADGLLKRDDNAIRAVFIGLVLGGVAMNYAGLSRPASGVEHYFSHIWDMRGLSMGTPVDFHGIQCAIGTLYAAKIYDKIRTVTPDKEKALQFVESFDYESYKDSLRRFLGSDADVMIALEEKEQKYNKEKHAQRLEIIMSKWDEIIEIINSEIPTAKEIERILDTINTPKTVDEIGIDSEFLPMTFEAAKDIRDKYVLSRLCWDLGIIEEINEIL